MRNILVLAKARQNAMAPARKATGLFATACLLVASTGWCKPGDLLWESLQPSDSNGRAYAVGAEGNVVVATGEAGTNCSSLIPASCNWYVRAFDAATGATLWKDKPQAADSIGRATAVTVRDGRVYAVGWMLGTTTYQFVARAYSLEEGKLLWEQRIGHAFSTTERAYAVEVRDGNVYVAGDLASAQNVLDFSTLVFDAKTGAVQWASETPGPIQTSGANFAFAQAVRIHGERVFTAGTILSSSGVDEIVLQAHDAQTGALLWQADGPAGYFQINPNSFDGLAVGGDMAFIGAGGATSDYNVPFDFLVRAYDMRTGATVWTDEVHRQAGGQATRVGFKDGRLFAYGWDCDETVYNCYADVRTYDAKTGVLQWESRFTGPGKDSTPPATAFAVHGDQVFIGNGLLDAQQDKYKWMVRSYDAADGSIRWENTSNDKGSQSDPVALKASGGRLFAAGLTSRTDGSYGFAVRAYSAPTRDDRDCDDE